MDDFDGVRLLTDDGDKEWTWKEFVKELKEEAGQGKVQIHTSATHTTIYKGTSIIFFEGIKEGKFWNTMEQHGWHSGMHPKVVRKNAAWRFI